MAVRNGPLFSERLNRRRLLQVAGGLLLMSVVDVHFNGQAAVAATRMSWQESGVFPLTGLYQSPVFQADQAFNSVELVWQGDLPQGSSADFAVRVSTDGSSWTDWIETHLDSHVRSLSDTRKFQVPALVSPSQYVQYRVNLVAAPAGPAPTLQQVELACVDTTGPAQYMDAPKLIDGFIIPRAGWGADESLRYDANGKEIWPPEYRPVQKVIIHHTVTQNHEQDPAATVRAIYYYHAITQGWGDIGYNFLVDWHGNVYEGRF
ncbi:MAG TPA: N-acetylmuramoyl-L-alanine amidase, partial [Nitrolancea sp.]